MPLRSILLCATLLLSLAASRAHAAAAPGAEPTEPLAATLSMNYPVRLVPVLLQPARQTLRSMVTGFYTAAAGRFTTLPTTGSLAESLDALPVIGTVRRRAGRRFNTDDASIDDFAICYRLSSHLGFQLIPGDPAPVKLAVTSVSNNAGYLPSSDHLGRCSAKVSRVVQ